jgi:hypothetical protein
MLPLMVKAPPDVAWIANIYATVRANSQAAAPRIFLIGGSSTHFSLSADVLAKDLGRPVFNLGSHAGLGAPYILHKAREFLSPGDTAIVSLEHEIIFAPREMTAALTEYVAFYDPLAVLRLSPLDAVHAVFAISPATLPKIFSTSVWPRGGIFYRPGTITATGDETMNAMAYVGPELQRRVAKLAPHPIRDVARLAATDPALRDFIVWARANSVNVFMSWPVMLQHPLYATDDFRRYYDEIAQVFRELGVAVLGQQSDYMLPIDDMFDTAYHANENGRIKVTKTLERFLLAAPR